MSIAKISISRIHPDPDQPRKLFDEGDLLALGQNMKAHGQQIPVIVYECSGKLILADGERRYRSAQLVGISELAALVLPAKPDAAALHILQMSLEAHKVSLTAMERSNLLARIKQENGWSVNELAERLNMKQPVVSKLLTYQKLIPEAQRLLHEGKLDTEKAHILSQRSAEEQAGLLMGVGDLTRDQLRAKARGTSDKPKSKRSVFVLPGGLTVTLQGMELTLDQAIKSLSATLKELRKGLSDGLDIVTTQRVMADKARAS